MSSAREYPELLQLLAAFLQSGGRRWIQPWQLLPQSGSPGGQVEYERLRVAAQQLR